MKFILVSGKAGVGKTTFSELLIYNIMYNTNKTAIACSFGRGVKDVARSLGWDGQKDEKGRRLLQRVGYLGREYDPSIWVKKLLAEVNKGPYPDFVVIDDWRFPNEYDYLVSQGNEVITVRIHSPEREILRGTPEYNDISETSLPVNLFGSGYNFYIINDCSIEELDLISKNFIPFCIDGGSEW